MKKKDKLTWFVHDSTQLNAGEVLYPFWFLFRSLLLSTKTEDKYCLGIFNI